MAAGMFPVLLLHRELAGGALEEPGVLPLPGLHGPGQGLRLVDDRHLDGGEEARVVFDSLKAVVLKTEISSQSFQISFRDWLELTDFFMVGNWLERFEL